MQQDDQDREISSAETTKPGVTRRALFQGAGAAAVTGAMLGKVALAKESGDAPTKGAPPRVQGPAAVAVEFTVNGSKKKLSIEPRETLLQSLRLGLDLTGAKPVCDRGQCGACTILLDGLPSYACTVLTVEAEGRSVTTVEGLGTPASMHPVQSSFVQHDAMQCGFCTPGMVVSCAYAVKTHGKNLTDEQVRTACAGNLCRCGTYPHVVSAALEAAKKGG